MNNKKKFDPQILESNGKKTHAVLTYDAFEELIDELDYLRAKMNDDGVRYPHELVKRLTLEDAHPIKIVREWRELTQEALAQQAKLSTNYISMLERGDRKLKSKAAAKLANALNVDIDMLMD